ncbi:hypothetical protein XarjCFBP7645_18230 [Xanthomonas arboricola]|uniref:Uncharacterized protein n=1 Tax=Xanthomonas arboricola TaxID=56448 RepID=A0A2S7AB96_9XANT|nr:hypothetical protein XarjCFBP7645_18230 [Xanthomonas arboricola]
MLCSQPRVPTIFDGPCPPTVAGPYAAWMPRKSLQGRTCGVSRDGGRARALQPSLQPSPKVSAPQSRHQQVVHATSSNSGTRLMVKKCSR